jgi:hypothetical protein
MSWLSEKIGRLKIILAGYLPACISADESSAAKHPLSYTEQTSVAVYLCGPDRSFQFSGSIRKPWLFG